MRPCCLLGSFLHHMFRSSQETEAKCIQCNSAATGRVEINSNEMFSYIMHACVYSGSNYTPWERATTRHWCKSTLTVPCFGRMPCVTQCRVDVTSCQVYFDTALLSQESGVLARWLKGVTAAVAEAHPMDEHCALPESTHAASHCVHLDCLGSNMIAHVISVFGSNPGRCSI